MNGTFATGQTNAATLDDLLKTLEKLKPNDEWWLAAPDGRVWKGRPEELLQVLLPHHPLLKQMKPFYEAHST